MTPKQKANELGNKFYQGSVFDYDNQGHLDEIVKAKKEDMKKIESIKLGEGQHDETTK